MVHRSRWEVEYPVPREASLSEGKSVIIVQVDGTVVKVFTGHYQHHTCPTI